LSEAATDPISHISVCVCTYRRPDFLLRLLNDLSTQDTNGCFTYSIVVCDNDDLRSAEQIVTRFAAISAITVTYCVEPQRSIALARNRAVQNANGDYIALIDDDEFPERSWLRVLFTACQEYGVDGVLGPVKPSFEEGVPQWIVEGRFYDRPCPETGSILAAAHTRTGNALLRTQVFRDFDSPFRPEFRAGEDVDFFRRAIERGRMFIWCNDAVVYETVPPSRWKRIYLLKKALLRGACAALRPTVGALNITKSIIAVLVYCLALPFAMLLGQHRLMDLLIRMFHHLGKLLALMGINPVADPYLPG